MLTYFYAIYVLVCGCILAIFFHNSFKDWLLRFIVVSFMPVIGWLFPITWPKKWFEDKGNYFGDYIQKQHDDLEFNQSDIHEKVEFEKELNVISIEDALIVSNHADRRRIMIDVLKEDTLKYLEVLKTAVGNDDTETSHYAVSAIVEVKRKLSIALQQFTVEYESSIGDPQITTDYAEVLNLYIKSGFLDTRTLRKHMFTYISLLNDLINLDDPTEFAFLEKTKTELELGLLTDAEMTSKLYLERYSSSEEAHLNIMRVYFTSKSFQNLNHAIITLKKSKIMLSNKGITMIRYWSEGA